jgi:hypothetical protein
MTTTKNRKKTTPLIRVGLSITLLCLSLSSMAEVNLQQVSQRLMYLETGYDPLAVGDGGKAFGVLQIHQICIDDVNSRFNTQYKHSDAFQVACAEEIFILYISLGIEKYCKKYGSEPTEEDIVRLWNGGWPKGYK